MLDVVENVLVVVVASLEKFWISKYYISNDEDVGVLAESLHLVIDQWIQYELGKQYL